MPCKIKASRSSRRQHERQNDKKGCLQRGLTLYSAVPSYKYTLNLCCLASNAAKSLKHQKVAHIFIILSQRILAKDKEDLAQSVSSGQ